MCLSVFLTPSHRSMLEPQEHTLTSPNLNTHTHTNTHTLTNTPPPPPTPLLLPIHSHVAGTLSNQQTLPLPIRNTHTCTHAHIHTRTHSFSTYYKQQKPVLTCSTCFSTGVLKELNDLNFFAASRVFSSQKLMDLFLSPSTQKINIKRVRFWLSLNPFSFPVWQKTN